MPFWQKFVSVPARQVTPAPQSATAVAAVQGLPLLAPVWQMSLLERALLRRRLARTEDVAVARPGARTAGDRRARPGALRVVVGAVRLAVPVVSGFRLIGMFPMNCAHRPPGQSPPVLHTALLFEPR